MNNSSINKMIETPVTSIEGLLEEELRLVIHSHINAKGKMVLNKEEAALLMIELYKFTNSSF